jgi:microcystin-dependent protein
MNLRRYVAGLSLVVILATASLAATLLPNARQTFLDLNGKPLSGGSVAFYIPNTTTLKSTWQDAAQTILNTNPVALDASGSAVIYGTGSYRQVVKDRTGTTIWDKITTDTSASSASFAGTSTGSSNAQVVAAANFSGADGQSITFIAGLTNTGPTTLNVSGRGPVAIVNDKAAGPVALGGGEIVTGNVVQVVYSATSGTFHTAIPETGVPAGTILETAGYTAPGGFLMAYGQCVNRVTYSRLYGVIGETYGACDGTTTFAVPDKRGRVAVGNDAMGGTPSGRLSTIPTLAVLGGTGGEQAHTLIRAELPAATINGTVTVSYPAHTYLHPTGYFQTNAVGGGATFVWTGSPQTADPTTPPANLGFSTTTENLGSGTPANVVQPSIAMNFIIKF